MGLSSDTLRRSPGGLALSSATAPTAAERVWALGEARQMIFRSMTGIDRISGLVLAKTTFHEAVKEVFNTFEYRRLDRLQANIINVDRHHLYLDAVYHVKLRLCPTRSDILSVFSTFRRCRSIFVESTRMEPRCYTFVYQGTVEGRPQATVTQHAPLVAHLWKDLPAAGPPIEGRDWSLDPKSFPIDWKIHSQFELPPVSTQTQDNSLGNVLNNNTDCIVLEILETAALASVGSIAGQLEYSGRNLCVREIIAPCELARIGWLTCLTRHWCCQFAVKRFRQSFPARRGTLRDVQIITISSLLSIRQGSEDWAALSDLSHLSIFVRHPCVDILPDTISNVAQLRRKLGLTRRTKSIPAWHRLPAYSAFAVHLSLLHLDFVYASTVSNALASSDIDELAQLLATCMFPRDVVQSLLRLGGPNCVFEFGLIGMETPSEMQQAVMDRITREMKVVFDRERLAITAAEAAGCS